MRPSIKTARVALGSLLLFVALTLAALASRSLPEDVLGSFAGFILGVVITPVAASPFEWAVHRYIYHRRQRNPLARIYSIHQAHHHAFFPTWRYVTAGPPRRIQILGHRTHASISPMTNAFTRSAHFCFYLILGLVLICAPVWFLGRNIAVLAGTVCSLLVISDLFIRVHDAIHRPTSHPRLQRQVWFRFLDRHHFIHHVDTEANVNFLLPLSDLLFGTLRRSQTRREIQRHGTLESAKRVLVGCGEPVAGPGAATREPAFVSA